MPISLPRFQRTVPLVDDKGLPEFSFHTWNDAFADRIEKDFNDLEDSVQKLMDLNSDDVLTPAKKPVWILFQSFLTSEQTDLDAKAATYGITTEKTNYDNAVSALNTYLGTLTTPVAWNNLTGNTTIIGVTFRSKFNDVLTTKQLLINKITEVAKSLADTADAKAVAAAREVARINSYTSPTNVLTASDAGTDATISIVAHTRIYPVQGSIDVPNVSIVAGSISGLAFSTLYYVYYIDTTLANTVPTFVATTNIAEAQVGYADGRHFVGKVTTPADGGTTTTGDGGSLPPGGGGGVLP